MTFKLATLMGVVLLLSLAAFGLLLNFYQDQVMAEVARTASEVGQATLRTFEWHDGPHRVGHDVVAGDGNYLFWQSSPADRTHDAEGATPPNVFAEHATVVGGTTATGEALVELHEDEAVRVIERFREMSPGGRRVVRRQTRLHPAGDVYAIRCESTGEGSDETECVGGTSGDPVAGFNQFFIRIDDVRAESDPAGGSLVLTIPRLTPEMEGRPRRETAASVDLVAHGDAAAAPLQATLEEIRFPIPVEEYEQLFDSWRGRSMFLFLGVFVVGMVLSAVVASRFTRPIRRLDAALRRISDGDLDAEVEIRGKDEVARLGRAFNDMTRKLRANRDRNRELVRREKLSALGRLAAGVAHDVRNPLHSIGLTLQHLRETGRPLDDGRAAEFDRSLEIIRGEIRRLDGLVGNFLGFANGGERRRHEVDLEGLLEETARLVRKEAEWRDIEVRVRCDGEVPAIFADGEAIRSSLLNLVLNSFEAMPDGGELTLCLRRSGAEAVLEVADTGRGIPREDHDRVFEFAYTTRDGGNGLGLAMVHQTVVEDHGGRVALESEPGEGTRVRIALPLPAPADEVAS